ncbi:unnamed protein product [Strongylus vulgaris]|uniref:Uncharacterized protein n=1 Tax=Strongylus vulgaris TaxID=40348 RepID=A0A3P7JK50_STRVU|nr:unnamed protein product [Strongylus vulgaris]
MSFCTKILISVAIIGSAAFFYEVQAAPTEIALREDVNSTAIDTLTGLDHSFRVKRQGGGGGGGDVAVAVPPAVPAAALVAVHAADHVAVDVVVDVVEDAVVDVVEDVVEAVEEVSCGCCGCGGGGRKRRSLDNLRIRLGMKQSAEANNEQPAEHEFPREKRNIMCQNLCAAPAPVHAGFPRSHEFYGDY